MYLFLAILMLSCAQFGSQLFLPALPDIAKHLAISNGYTQQIMMLYFASFGLSQLVFGPWSDRVGRRKIFLIGQSFFIIGSLLSALATSPTMLAVGRILQGLGAGAPLLVSRTLLSDTLSGEKLKQTFASLAVAASLISVLAPLLGGWITTVSSWQSLFIFITIYLAVTWIIGFKLLPQPTAEAQKSSLGSIAKEYAKLMIDLRFITAASFKWLPSLLFLTCVTYFPFEFQQKLGLSAQEYGFYMTLSTTGLILGTILAKIAQKHLSYPNILAVFWPLLLLSGLGFYLLPFSLINTLGSYAFFMVCAGAFYPCCLQLIVEPFRDKAGTVNALSGAIDMFVTSLIAIVVIKYWLTDMQSLGILFLIIAGMLAISWCLMVRQKGELNEGLNETDSVLINEPRMVKNERALM
jgi:DHA1 family 2-module integral membrane pump EmrD-like MFS transporter